MAATYTIQPLSIPAIFEALVSEVSTNLASATIPQVSFRHGTWLDILKELTVDSNSPTESVKNGKYPLVCLIHQFDERPFDSISETTNLTLIIVTSSTIDATTDARYTDNFIPILYPIYAELKQVIADSMYFLGYNQNFSHIKRDLTHAGQSGEDGNTAYKLPDVLDGLLMTNIDLKVNLDPICEPPTPNFCLLTPCPYGREAYYENCIKNVTFIFSGTTLIASVNDFYFVDASGGLPAPFAPEIDWGDGGLILPMDAPTPPDTVPFTASLNTGALSDGFYVGRISFDDSWIDFYYLIVSGVAVKYTSLVEFDYSYDLACTLYPNNTMNSNITYTTTKQDGQSSIIVGYKYSQFSVELVSQTFSAVDTITKDNEFTSNFLGSNYEIIHKIDRGGQSPLQCVMQIKTRCKTQF